MYYKKNIYTRGGFSNSDLPIHIPYNPDKQLSIEIDKSDKGLTITACLIKDSAKHEETFQALIADILPKGSKPIEDISGKRIQPGDPLGKEMPPFKSLPGGFQAFIQEISRELDQAA